MNVRFGGTIIGQLANGKYTSFRGGSVSDDGNTWQKVLPYRHRLAENFKVWMAMVYRDSGLEVSAA